MKSTKRPSQKLVERRLTLLKSSLSLIPYIGSTLNEILFDLPNRIQQHRINETVEILNEKMKVIDENTISIEYLESADFFDFTRRLFEESLKIGSIEKRKTLAAIYFGAITGHEDFENGRSSLFMRFTVDITPEQINILKYVEGNESPLNQIGSYEKFFQVYLKQNLGGKKGRYDFKFYCSDLENKALISLGAGLEDFKSKSGILTYQGHEEASVTITELGYAFLHYLKN